MGTATGALEVGPTVGICEGEQVGALEGLKLGAGVVASTLVEIANR